MFQLFRISYIYMTGILFTQGSLGTLSRHLQSVGLELSTQSLDEVNYI